MTPDALLTEAETLLATAESRTGGLIATVLTVIAGSSDVVDRGFLAARKRANRSKPSAISCMAIVPKSGPRQSRMRSP